MRLLVACIAALGAAYLSVGGCGKPSAITDVSAGTSSSEQVTPLAKQFGEYVLKGDWPAAYAMTTPAFQADVPMSDLQKQYEVVLAQLRRGEPSFTPDSIEVDMGPLPIDEEQAQRYGVKTVPPKANWKAWIWMKLIGNDSKGRAMGMETILFAVSDNGQDKFAMVRFDHIN